MGTSKSRGSAQGSATAKGKGSGTRSLGVITAAATLAAVALLSPVAAVVAMCGLLPTFTAILVDMSENKPMAVAIGGMNVAGVFPFLPVVWMTGGLGSRADVVEIVFPLTIMYGSAGLGWLLAKTLPQLVYAIYNAERDRKIATLRQVQDDLVAKWGPAVIPAGKSDA
jgi:hypothetical protein